MACCCKDYIFKEEEEGEQEMGEEERKGMGRQSPPTRPDAVTIGPLQKTSAGLCSLRYNEGNIYFSSFEGLCTLWKNPTPRRAARTQCEEDAKPPPATVTPRTRNGNGQHGGRPEPRWEREGSQKR